MASNKAAGFMKGVKSLVELVEDFDRAAQNYGAELEGCQTEQTREAMQKYDLAKAKLLQRIKNVEKLVKQLKSSNRSLKVKARG